jgi:hypothetical protein
MKLTFILILLLMVCSGFYQNKISRGNISFRVYDGTYKNLCCFPGNDSFPFLINAVIPWNNYFKSGEYLFEKWVKGSIVSVNNELIKNDTYFFNYNKVSQNLFLTIDFKEIFEIDNREFKSFTLTDGPVEYCFEHQKIIDNNRFFQVLVKNKKYSLYKYTAAKFRKDNIPAESGGFVNWYSYYLVFPGERIYKVIRLKKKSISRNIYTEPEKTEAYFLLHQHKPVDETFLIGLVNFLNQ